MHNTVNTTDFDNGTPIDAHFQYVRDQTSELAARPALDACVCGGGGIMLHSYATALCIAFWKFAKKHTQVLGKYGHSVHRHIEDGVCLPAMDKFLSRHVSRRSIFFYTTCV